MSLPRLPCLAVLAAFVAACGPTAPPRAALAPSDSWCPDGFEVGPQDTCFAVPEPHGKDTPVLVYLHGMYRGHGSPEEWALVRTATQRGFAVVVPRGKRGQCAWKAELADHFCWPHEPEDAQSFRATVAEWDRVLWQVDALLDGGTHPRFVLGSSNGGFFAAHLAAARLFKAEGWAIVNGGALNGAPPPPPGGAPMLIVAADDDAEPGPRALHADLAKHGVPHAFCGRPGGPALSAADVDGALAFFRKVTRGGAASAKAACEAPLRPAAP